MMLGLARPSSPHLKKNWIKFLCEIRSKYRTVTPRCGCRFRRNPQIRMCFHRGALHLTDIVSNDDPSGEKAGKS
jgi:hypothetical protein